MSRETVAAFCASLAAVVKDASAAGIPAFCIRRELRGHLAALAEGEEDGRLWCVHVLGPDTIIAQPSKAVAEARAALWNEDFAKLAAEREPSPYWPVVECRAEVYPYSATGHARGIAEHGGDPGDIC
jgi:hypothetical protein